MEISTPLEIMSPGREVALALEVHDEFATFVLSAAPSTASASEGSRWSILQHGHHVATVESDVSQTVSALLDRGRRGMSPKAERLQWLKEFSFPYTPFTPPGLEPPPDPDRDAVTAALAEARSGIAALSDDAERIGACETTVPHPFYGPLTPLWWVRFIAVHTRHHLELARR